jgi:hypothetical protein
MQFSDKLKSFPPILCRLLGRRPWAGPLSTKEIAEVSGLSEPKVETISQQTGWDEITVGDMFAFLTGCGIPLDNSSQMRRVLMYLRRNPEFEYLFNDSEWKTRWLPMLVKFRKIYPSHLVPGTPQFKPLRRLLERLAPII